MDEMQHLHSADARIARELSHLDRRVAVLETLAEVAESRLSEVRADIAGLRAEQKIMGKDITMALNGIASDLHTHMENEEKDRLKLLVGVMGAFAAGILSLFVWGAPWVWQHLITK